MNRRALFRFRVIVANLANVPVQSARRAADQAADLSGHAPDVLILTECWHRQTRRELRKAFPHHDWHMIPGQSVVIGWDRRVWRLVARWARWGHRALSRVCDTRMIPDVRLQHIASGRVLRVLGYHSTPIPTRKAPDQVPTARKLQRALFVRLAAILRRTGYAAVAGGDANKEGPVLGRVIAPGRLVRSAADGIDKLDTIDGVGLKLHLGRVRHVRIRHTDHKDGAILADVSAHA